MRDRLSALLISTAIWMVCGTSGAAPAATSEAELEKKADTIVEGESNFVVCNGVVEHGAVRLQQFIANIKPYKWHKGVRVDSLAVEGAVAIDPLPLGFIPSPPLPRGWRGKVYLVKTGKNLYGLASDTALVEDKKSSTPSDLPRCGESGDGARAPAPSAVDPNAAKAPADAADSAIGGEPAK